MERVGDFEAFFDEQYEPVVRSLTLVFGDRATAEDAAQVGFEKAFRKWRQVAEMERPGTWVYVVALRHARRALDRDRRGSTTEAPVPVSGPERTVIGELWVRDAIEALPARQRAVVVLRHLVGMPLGEIAEALRVSTGTVKSTLHAAHTRLRLELVDEDDAPGERPVVAEQEVSDDARG
jgi:RNA polymerase sigma-70 factor (ECF subfamily)